MNEANNRDSEFLGYEYKELSVEQSRVSMYLDGYKNLDGSRMIILICPKPEAWPRFI